MSMVAYRDLSMHFLVGFGMVFWARAPIKKPNKESLEGSTVTYRVTVHTGLQVLDPVGRGLLIPKTLEGEVFGY